MHIMPEEDHHGKLAALGLMHADRIPQGQLLHLFPHKCDLTVRRVHRDLARVSTGTDYSAGLAIPDAQTIIILRDEYPIAAAQRRVLAERWGASQIEARLQGGIEHLSACDAVIERTEHLNGERI